jgi:hypothetical protein
MDEIFGLTHVMGMTFSINWPKTCHDPHVNNDDDNFVE